MHQRGLADTIADRGAVEKKHTAFPHGANMKIRIFHQPDRWVEAAQPFDTFTPDDGRTADQNCLIEEHAPGKSKAGAESAAQGSLTRRVSEVLTFVIQLRRRSIAERFDSTENEADGRVRRECSFDRRIMSFSDDVVVVQEVYKLTFCQGPSDVPHHTGDPPGRVGISQIGYPWVLESSRRLFSGSLRAVVDDEDLDSRVVLPKHAGYRCAEFARTAKRRNDDRKIDRHEPIRLLAPRGIPPDRALTNERLNQ